MKLKIEEKEGVSIIRIHGRMFIGDDTRNFRKALLNVLDKSDKVLVDLSDCRYMDSAGIGEMVRSLMTAQDRGAVSYTHLTLPTKA